MTRFNLHTGKAAVKPLVGPAIALGLAVAMAATPTTALNAAPSSMQDNAILMSVGGSKVINLGAKMSDVVIGNPEVVDVHVRAQNQLYLIAKAAGETTVFATATNGKVLFSGTVRVGNNLSNIDDMLRLAMPNAQIAVNKMNGMVLLTGTVAAPEDAAEAERLTQAFVGKDVTVVSRLRTATPLQVNLQVKIAEVSRDLGHQIGVNLRGLGTGSGSFSGYMNRSDRGFATSGSFVPGLPNGDITRQWTFNSPIDGTTSLGFIAKLLGMDVAGALDLAESSGLATALAQPNLTALSGETASFLAGGEFPIPVAQNVTGGSSAITVEFKPFGVSLAFTPTVLADGVINMVVQPEVSSIDPSASVVINNLTVPGLQTRRAKTVIEIRDGESFAMAGLIRKDFQDTIRQVPLLGSIPIIGTLFRSTGFQNEQTELVIIVTPRLVQPSRAGTLKLPTDRAGPPNEADLFLNGRTDTGVPPAATPFVTPPVAPPPPPMVVSPPATGGMADAKKPSGFEKDYGHVL